MKDVAPEMRNKLIKLYNQQLALDPQCKAYKRKLTDGGLSEMECIKYTKRIGKIAADAACKVVNKDALPDGILYWNIAESVLIPFFQEVQEKVLNVAEATWKIEDDEQNIHIRIKRPPFPEERIHSLLNLWVNKSLEEKENAETDKR